MRTPTLRGARRRPRLNGMAVLVGSAALLLFMPASSAVQAGDGPAPAVTTFGSDWTPPYLEGVRPSDELAGPAVVSGRLTDADGSPTSGRVAVVVWPRAEAMAALDDGDPVKTIIVGQDIAGPDGRFEVKVDPSVPLGEYTEDDGTLNLEIRAHGAKGTGLFAFSRRFVGESEPHWEDPGFSGDQASSRVAGDAAVALDGPVVGASGSAPMSGDKTGTCPDYIVDTYRNVPVDVGETYNGPVNTSRFIYQQGSTSSLGVGVSVSGAFGSYSVGGTAIGTTTSTITWPWTSANQRRLYRTTYTYRKIDIWNGYYTCEHWRYEVRPVAWEGGSASLALSYTPNATWCAPQDAGAQYEKVTGTAYTFTAGVYLSAYIGANLSARTGFNTLTAHKYDFVSAGRLCGTNAMPPDAARLVGKGP